MPKNPFLVALPNTSNSFTGDYYQQSMLLKVYVSTETSEVPVVENTGDTVISFLKKPQGGGDKKRKSDDIVKGAFSSSVTVSAGAGEKARRVGQS